MELITPCYSDIVNLSIPSKSKLHGRFGSTINKYTFTLPPTKLGMKGKDMHIHTIGTQTDIPNRT